MPLFPKNNRFVVFSCPVENHCKYMCNYFIMFCAKSLIKLCLRAPNDIFNVLPPKHLSMPAVYDGGRPQNWQLDAPIEFIR